MSTTPTNAEELRAEVSARYARTALKVLGTEQPAAADACCAPTCCTPSTTAATVGNTALPVGEAEQATAAGCCGSSCCSTDTRDASVITSDLYGQAELGAIPLAAALASLGSGNPTALAELKPGERVLDLGSGGGIDVLLSARRVGPTGFAYGLDMTDAMLELAERNRAEVGVENVRFLKGIIEDIPLPAESVDVVVSNCVINLSADKGQVLRGAYRVLAPGGRFAVSDIVFQGQLPQTLRTDMESWAGCIAGALEEETYRTLLGDAGFTDIEVEVTRRYSLADIAGNGASASISALPTEEQLEVDGKFVCRVQEAPVNALRVVREGGTCLQHAIADGDNSVEALAPKDLEVIGNHAAHLDAEAFYAASGQGMQLFGWLASGALCLHHTVAEMAKRTKPRAHFERVAGPGCQ